VMLYRFVDEQKAEGFPIERTIGFGPNYVSVYDANTNSWTQRAAPAGIDLGFGMPGLGAVYDPVSGLVLVVTRGGTLTAYDVDADKWTAIGTITEPRGVTSDGQTLTAYPPFLIGYVAEADRLAFLGFNGAPFQDHGALINPRVGSTTALEEPEGGVMGGFGSFRYATSGDTAYTYGDRDVCRLDPATLDWDCTASDQREAMPAVTVAPVAMVYDPINARIVVINNWCCTWPGSTVLDNVWAIDFGTGEQIELLATANARTETDGS
jgi:hypothetical protein